MMKTCCTNIYIYIKMNVYCIVYYKIYRADPVLQNVVDKVFPHFSKRELEERQRHGNTPPCIPLSLSLSLSLSLPQIKIKIKKIESNKHFKRQKKNDKIYFFLTKQKRRTLQNTKNRSSMITRIV